VRRGDSSQMMGRYKSSLRRRATRDRVAWATRSIATQVDQFAGHDCRREACVFRVFVHDPGHDRGIGSHVGRRDVDGRADDLFHAGDEQSGEIAELRLGQLGRTAVDTALGAAIGKSTTAVFQVIKLAKAAV